MGLSSAAAYPDVETRTPAARTWAARRARPRTERRRRELHLLSCRFCLLGARRSTTPWRITAIGVPVTERCDLGPAREAQARHLPARGGREEITVGRPDVRARGQARAAPQNHLARHELTVVLAQIAFQGTEARIGQISARRPFPHVAEHLGGAVIGGGARGQRGQRGPFD